MLTGLTVQNELVQERVPVPWRRFRIWTVSPKLGNHPGVVAAWHHVDRVGRSREGVHLMALPAKVAVLVVPSRQAAVLPLVKRVQLV